MDLKPLLRRLRASPAGPIVNYPRRILHNLPLASQPLRELAVWGFKSREDTNYTYQLTRSNERHLAHAIAKVTGVGAQEALGYIDELKSDKELADHIISATASGPYRGHADLRADYSKRLGWYAIARILKPEVVVETGIDKGLGSVVLAAALIRNGRGRLYGTDINPRAGQFLTGRYAEVSEILYGDSLKSLAAFDRTIDLFINDSDHSARYEREEYEMIHEKLSPTAIVLGDNAHCTDELIDWSEEVGRQFLFWSEKPQGHWYPGCGIGFSFPA